MLIFPKRLVAYRILISEVSPGRIRNLRDFVQENKVIATYNSITDKGFYKFIDAKNVEHLFYDLDGSLDIELEDENYLDKKFSITWKTKEIDELDDEGEETGNKITVKIIFTITTVI